MNQSMNAITIDRHQSNTPFDQLRAELIDEVQALSSFQWTDFNLHDPGVTILEQLAYALTDVHYRTQYSAAELLADHNDTIELHKHGLFAPEDAFVCRAVSQRDLQCAILNDVPQLAYVQVSYSEAFPGLLDLCITSQEKRVDRPELLEEVSQAYHRHRNLNENLHRIHFIERSDATLAGHISIHPNVVAEQVVAAVFFTVQQFLLGTIASVDYQEREQSIAGSPFDGPRMRHHFINRSDLEWAEKPRSISALIEQLMQLTGLASVKALSIQEISHKGNVRHLHFLPPACELALYLIPPLQTDVADALAVWQQGSRIELDTMRLRHEFQALISQFKNRRQLSSMPSTQPVLTQAYCDLTDYSSVQSQFPSNYGINAFGVPAHSDTKRKAQARQLQGYLLLYDHVLNDHLQLLESLKQLFSLDIQQARPYPSRGIEDPQAYDLAGLYKKTIPEDFLGEHVFGQSMAEKKTECLDLLTAMNGREKTRYAHELFPTDFSLLEQQQHHLESQKKSLSHVHQWSEHRGGARNLYQCSPRATSALEKRIRLLLDAPVDSQSLQPKSVDAVKSAAISNKVAFQRVKAQLSGLVFRPMVSPLIDSIEDESLLVTPVSVNQEEADIALIIYLNQRAQKLSSLWSSWLYVGADLNRYRIAQLLDKRTVDLFFNPAPEGAVEQWHYLGSFNSEQATKRFANLLRHVALTDVQRRHGVHLVEHLPLLPTALLDESVANRQAIFQQQPFYFNQLTWILPSDTTRNKRTHFSHFVAKKIWQECPAHLYSHILFLDIPAMQTFETLFADWQTKYCQQDQALDSAANALKDFLQGYLLADQAVKV